MAHFIKKKDDEEASELRVRHHGLRNDLERKGRVLLRTVESNENIRRHVTGIDAAANEMDAGPEVFAPLYRLFRRRGFTHFTFHAGEDYIHLISGIRLLYEAVEFLDLRHGDRLGHATAVGIDPKLWQERCNTHLVMTKQEWLDNLIFAHNLLIGSGNPVITRIENAIDLLAGQIYRKSYQVGTYHRAWQLRKLDPQIACQPGSWKRGNKLTFEDQVEWDKVEKAKKEDAIAFEIFRNYHRKEHIERGNELIKVVDLFDAKTLLELQQKALELLYDKGIVIETMPTSNVRISYYHNHKEHHIWRWLDAVDDERFARDREKKPTLCIGSDDPGIFATNIVNEYAHIYQGLCNAHTGCRDEAAATIQQLSKNARTYRFESIE